MASWARLGAVALSLVLCANAAFAKDGKKTKKTIAKGESVTVTLKGEREVKGIYLGRHHNAVWVGVSGGEIGLDEDQVLTVTPTESPEHEFLRRKAALDAHDAKGFWELSMFASQNDLTPQAQSAAQHVLSIDPDHVEARAFFGYVKVNGSWMTFDQAEFRKGNVHVDGKWMSEEESKGYWESRRGSTRGLNPHRKTEQLPVQEDSSVRKVSGYIQSPPQLPASED